MSSPAKLVIWGAGGHARVVADLVRRQTKYALAGFIDDAQPGRKGETFCEAKILGGRDALAQLRKQVLTELETAFAAEDLRFVYENRMGEANGISHSIAMGLHRRYLYVSSCLRD